MILGVSNKVFYYKNSGVYTTFDLCYRLTFKENVDVEVLQKATRQTLTLFPEFSVYPAIIRNRLVYKRNTAAVACFNEYTGSHVFGTHETNGYLFCFYVMRNELCVSFFHGLTDCRGMFQFLNVLVSYYYHYCTQEEKKSDTFRTLAKSSIRLLANAADEGRLCDPYTDIATTKVNLRPKHLVESFLDVKKHDAFVIPEDSLYPHSNLVYRHSLCIDNNAFTKKVKERQTRFSLLLAIIIASAIADVYDKMSKPIIVMLPVDLRPYYKINTAVNFSDGIFLPFTMDFLKSDMDVQCKKLKEIAEAQLDVNYFDQVILNKVELIRDLEQSGKSVVELSENLLKRSFERREKKATFALSYIGRQYFPFPQSSIVESIHPDFWFHSFGVVVSVCNDEMELLFAQRFESDDIILACQKRFEKMGFLAKRKNIGSLQANPLLLNRLKTF